MSKAIVIGGGAAGMMAAISCAQIGHSVVLLEQNEKLGKKIFITGKGRCNLTNACDTEQFFRNVVTNPKFLYSSLYGFDPSQVMAFFEEQGLKLKTERGNRVFPQSDHSSDVIKTLERALKDAYVDVRLHTKVAKIVTKGNEEKRVSHVQLSTGEKLEADVVIVATGGKSYTSTGSTGDGLRFAKELGLSVTECYPALCPLHTKETWPKSLMGLSLKNVSVTIKDGKKQVYDGFGEMLFTHFGVSGPLILSASSYVNRLVKERPLLLTIDLKPALDMEQLDHRLIREFEENPKKQFKNALGSLFPSKMIPVMVDLSGIDAECKVSAISKEERKRFASLIKAVPLTVVKTAGFEEAIITSGGVNVKEINPSTMEAKKVKGLYFAGEVLDTDALTGGFNLQIAWSTGHLAGSSVEW
ncbi:MAG: NAD(P)/FAD-dependent oxidoreductase [Lachnospiraceae bacterium]|nr:NAD(P)/FAD-dependent oxidoreductase [Lachnospiraceae bacterium]